MSEILPSTHRSRAVRRRGPHARLADRLVPATALSWGRLTRETDEWMRAAVRWQLEAIPATVVRPCPAFDRLDALMSGSGKVASDAMNPASFNQWWQA